MRTQPPPAVPALGASEAEVLSLYPSAALVPAKDGFAGRVLCASPADDLFHFVFVDGRLEEAVFNTRWSSDSSDALERKLEYFLNAYGGSDNYHMSLDNGFGYTLERNDRTVFALYSYACDVFSVGLMRDGRVYLRDWERRDEAT